jgi:hypothetical protein
MDRKSLLKKALQTFLREAGAWSRALASLEFRVRFANHVNRSFAFHDLAISVTAFRGSEGRKNFHGVKMVKATVIGATGARKLANRSFL